MDVLNSTSGTTLAKDVREARGFIARGLGLMFRSAVPGGGGLAIRPCSSIHMFFMRFSIDAVFFDKELRVTKVARRVRPWVGIAFGGKGSVGVIELPAGTASDTAPGHTLVMDPAVEAQ